MELGQRIREYRAAAQMTQEELAERMFVSRQTISSWENDKSYPDIRSLLMLGDLFDVSLDVLVKGDVEIMKEKINETTIRSFSRDSNIFTVLLIAVAVTPMLLLKLAGIVGVVIWAGVVGAAIYFSLRLEKVKKQYDVHTYKEIVAFMNGEKLEGIEKAREEGKRSYQKFLLTLACAIFAFTFSIAVSVVIELLK